jgi:G3E family GTPase
MNAKPVRMILVGGFLGAGKTTLLARAAERLVRQGRRVGLITNDQARNLVDTALLLRDGYAVQEVAGGCFCCRIGDLLAAADRLLAEQQPDVLIGEPVGSCTDLSATVLQPLKDLYGDRFRVAPFSVLADPGRLRQALAEGAPQPFPESITYIFLKQLEEADLIVINKVDTLSSREFEEIRTLVERRFPGRRVLAMSAAGGSGIDEWLAAVQGDAPAGSRIAAVDYDIYADGEAALGWLNAVAQLRADSEADWRAFCEEFLEQVRSRLQLRGAEVAHAKVVLSARGCEVAANLTGNEADVSVRGDATSAAIAAQMVVNVRAHIAPDDLRDVVEASLQAAAGERYAATIESMQHFAPIRPQPVHRYEKPV